MKKNNNNNNRGKATLGAMIAAGVTAGAISAGCGNSSQVASPVQQPQDASVEITAADKVVIDGHEVQLDDTMPTNLRRDVAKPMYGVRQNPIRLLYGPRPRPGIGRPVTPMPDVEPQGPAAVEPVVFEIVASTLNMNIRHVGAATELKGLSLEQRNQLKAELEKRFEVSIPNDSFNNVRTAADLVNTICALKF